MYCRTCGKKLMDNAEVCIDCGCNPLAGKSYCQNCGAKTIEQQELCTQCGVRLRFSAHSRSNPSNNLILAAIIGVPLGLLALAIMIAFPPLFLIVGLVSSIIASKKKKRNEQSQSEKGQTNLQGRE